MDSVSSFFDLLHEPERQVVDAEVETAKEGHERISVEMGPKDVHKEPEAMAGQSNPLISPYWYLEDDPRRVANQLTDKLTEKILLMIIVNELDSTGQLPPTRVEMQRHRPPFLMNIMSTNSTKLAQKSLPLFEAIDAVIMCFLWTSLPYTVGVGMLLTHAILRPALVTILPPFLLLHKFLIPSYLKLYPPDKSVVDDKYFLHNPVPHEGRPLSRWEGPKTISQYSREFLMNFTDLQNHIVPYVRLHDQLVSWGKHYFLFEDQMLSTAVYLILVCVMGFNLVFLPYLAPLLWQYLPLRAMAVVLVWLVFISFHPRVHEKLLDLTETEEARLKRLDYTYKMENMLLRLFDNTAEPEDMREVEMFEILKLNKSHTWDPLGFAAEFYSLNHPARAEEELPPMAGDFDGVKPPQYWEFADDSWRIDMQPTEWVQDNCVMDLVSIDDDEKWVYDFGSHDPQDTVYYRRRRWVRNCRPKAEARRSSVPEVPVRQIHRRES